MADQILQCETGHTWTRPSQRGRPPTVCPDWPNCGDEDRQTEIEEQPEQLIGAIEPAGVNPFIQKAAQKASQASERPKPRPADNLAKAREAKAQKAAQRSKEELEQMRQELSDIGDRIEKADKEYTESLQAACRASGCDDALWNRSDNKQRALLNLLARRQFLQKTLESPATPKPVSTPKPRPAPKRTVDMGIDGEPGGVLTPNGSLIPQSGGSLIPPS